MKKLFLLFAAMCCMMVAKAQEFTDTNGIKYEVTSTENKTVEVISKDIPGQGGYVGDIVIPATVTNGGVTYNVTGIGEYAFAECSSLTSIILPSGVTSISSDAFNGCSSLASINIPSGVTSISSEAFFGCSSLASINIPSGVTSIGNHAFAGCSSLTDIILPDKLESFGKLSFRLCNNLAYVTFQGTTPPSLPGDSDYYPFNDSGKDVGGTKLYVPNDDAVTAYENAGYTNVYNPLNEFKSEALDEIATAMNGVTLTQDDAAIVSACKESINQATDIETILQERDHALSVINLQKAKDGLSKNKIWYTSSDSKIVTPHMQDAFGGATIVSNEYVEERGMYCITFDGDITSIGSNAFSGCTGLTSITIPGSVTSIGGSAFGGCTGLTSITIPGSVTSIGIKAFLNCTGLTSITIPGSVTSIERSAFAGCTGLVSITISDGVKSIVDEAFRGCTGLTSITIPGSVTSIGGKAFCACSGLTSITLPSSLERMSGGSQFSGCSNLVNANFLGTTPPLWDATYPFGSSRIEVGGTVLFVPDEDAVTSYKTAGYTNVYSYSASINVMKSQVSDEIAKAQTEVTLTSEDAAIVTACLTNINNATDIETILQERTAALSVINLQKAKNAAIAAIAEKMTKQTDEVKTDLTESVLAWKERINSATTITVVNNELELAKAKIDAIAEIYAVLDDIGSSTLTQEDIEDIEECRRNITEATDKDLINIEKEKATAIILQKPRSLAKENLRSCYTEVAQYITESDLEPYFARIDNATTKAGIDGIVKEANSAFYAVLSEKLKDTPHFVIGDKYKWYLATLKGINNEHKYAEYRNNSGYIYFMDGAAYQNDYLVNALNVEFTRTLPEGVWQCWYEPFEVYVDTKRFDAAEVAGILIKDNDETIVAFKKLKNGARMKENTVYVIRAKEGQGRLSMRGASPNLHESTETKLVIQSAYDNYTLTGNYSPVEHGDWYTLDKTGTFRQMANGSLKPQRFYLTITPRKDAYYPKNTAASAPPFICMTVLGDDDDETTGIETIDNGQLAIDNSQFYDLQGRKVTSIQKGQIYIVNGKKFIAR